MPFSFLSPLLRVGRDARIRSPRFIWAIASPAVVRTDIDEWRVARHALRQDPPAMDGVPSHGKDDVPCLCGECTP